MQIVKRKENIGHTLFFIAILLELLIMMTDHSQITLPLRGRVSHLAFVLFGCKILTTDYTKKEWCVVILLGILGSLSYLTCRDEYVIRAIVMVAASKGVDLKKVIEIVFFAALAGTTLIIVLSLTGVMGEVADIRDYGRGMIEKRYCLGFKHANNVHDMFWYLAAWFLLLNHKECNIRHYVALSAANVLLFFLTWSRTGLITAEGMILFAALVHYFKKMNQKIWIYLLSLAGTLGIVFLTLMGGIYGRNHPILLFFDRLFTGRIWLVYEYAPVREWTFFPLYHDIEYVDNGFAYLFAGYGIVVGVFYLFWIAVLICRMYRTENGIALAVLFTTVLVTFMESTFVFNTSLLCNPMFVLLFGMWNRLEVEK